MKYLPCFLICCLLISCLDHNPNETMENLTTERANEQIASKDLLKGTVHKVYVPIYSNVYNGTKSEKVLLTATLSIRNTSEIDSLFVSRVSYFNTEGNLVRNYVEQPIYLKPLETIEYIISQNDDTGGSGANFMIDWYGKDQLKPIFQAVMIGGLASRSFSFTTEGQVVP